MDFRKGQRVYVDMGRLTGGKPIRIIDETLAPVRYTFAEGAFYEGIVRDVSPASIKVELLVAGVKGHVVDSPPEYLKAK